MKILMMGPQGSGKGTIGKMLSNELAVPHITVGGLLRAAAEKSEELRKQLNEGILVSYELTADLIKEHIQKNGYDSYILDGWARNIGQLDFFNPGFDKVIYLTISRETSIRRLTGRRICSKCGWMCNVFTMPPNNEGFCDECGGYLTQREDDTEEAVNRRLDIFYSETMESVERFRKLGILSEVSAEELPEEILPKVLETLQK